MRSPGQAARDILEHINALPVERLPITEALGRVAAADVSSPIDLPPWDNSAMDGYAARSDDLTGAATGAPAPELRVVEVIPAGTFPSRALRPGECSRIFTGAPLPDGSDTVIRQEDVTDLEEGRVRIDDLRDVGRNVRHRGEDIERDRIVIEKGTPLDPAHVGLLASIAQLDVSVHRKPKVAILGSGDEIADLDERDAILRGHKIASSNTYTLVAMIARAGATATNLGIARDDPADLRARLAGAAGADLLVTSAGISVGEHDHMRTVLEDMGADLKFWRLRMRPGAPVGFGIVDATPWIGLPGNPVSTMVTFELFARPTIRKMLGHRAPFRRTVRVHLAEPLQVKSRVTHFLRAVVTEHDGTLSARLTGSQGSGILTSMAKANALLIAPADQEHFAEGEILSAMMFHEPIHVEEPPFE